MLFTFHWSKYLFLLHYKRNQTGCLTRSPFSVKAKQTVVPPQSLSLRQKECEKDVSGERRQSPMGPCKRNPWSQPNAEWSFLPDCQKKGSRSLHHRLPQDHWPLQLISVHSKSSLMFVAVGIPIPKTTAAPGRHDPPQGGCPATGQKVARTLQKIARYNSIGQQPDTLREIGRNTYSTPLSLHCLTQKAFKPA